MPNIKSAMKRDQLSKAQNLANKSNRSALKTTIKKFDAAVAEGNADLAASTYTAAVRSIDQATSKGLLHKNNAAHKKSRLTIALNTMAK